MLFSIFIITKCGTTGLLYFPASSHVLQLGLDIDCWPVLDLLPSLVEAELLLLPVVAGLIRETQNVVAELALLARPVVDLVGPVSRPVLEETGWAAPPIPTHE